MELYESKNDYILVKNDKAVFCDRITGKLTAQSADDLCKAWNPVCLGQVVGLIGKIKYHPDSVWRLLLIRNSELVGVLPGGTSVYRVNRIAVLPLTAAEPVDLDIELCKRHHFGIKRTEKIMHSPDDQKSIMKAFHQIRTAAENVKPKKGIWQTTNPDKEIRDREKFESRVHEELVKIFEDDCSFYYSPDGDLTNTLQRQQHLIPKNANNDSSGSTDSTNPRIAWESVDHRFFWNETLLSDILEQQPPAPDAAAEFVLPLMQGFVQVEQLTLDPPGVSLLTSLPKASPGSSTAEEEQWEKEKEERSREPIRLTLALVSRRSKYRAGTRFRRRGVDENGYVANFVETEQIMEIHHDKGAHIVSFIQVRGSVPLFWSQSGIKYRPPPKLERADADNEAAFCKHFVEQLGTYDQLIVVSLVETTGQSESPIADAYLKRIMHFNSSSIKFVTFDFHDYCRKMHFENVSQLLEGLTEIFRDMKYFWTFNSSRMDSSGIINEQKTVFRVNCIDCLDRTNVVQTAFARVVIEIQLRKLGLLYPDDSLPDSFQRVYQSMWANNGDSVSRQYTSTPALKGDYTRTGERTFNGMMRDGVNSANRYFWRLKEFHRQLAIDVLLGNESHSPEIELIRQTSLSDNLAILKQKEDNMKILIDKCRQLCMDRYEEYVGGWGLIASNESDSSQQDMDTVLLVTNKNYHVIRFKAGAAAVCQRISIGSIERIELGLESTVFKSRAHYSMRIYFGHPPGCYHAFRQPQFRLFNNMLVPVKSEDEALESLRAIAESFNCASMLSGIPPVNILEVRRLERRRTRNHPPELTQDISLDELKLSLPQQWQRVINNTNSEVDVTIVARRSSVQTQLRVKWGNMKEKVRFTDFRSKFMPSAQPAQSTQLKSPGDDKANTSPDEMNDESEISDSEAELLMMLKRQEEEEEEEEIQTEEEAEDLEIEEIKTGKVCSPDGQDSDGKEKNIPGDRVRKKKQVGIGSAQLADSSNVSTSNAISLNESATSDVLLSSCGIVATSQELWDSLPQAVDELAHSEDQFALAVVQDVAMRKAASREMRRHMERISLQLSFDDELSPKLFSTASSVLTGNTMSSVGVVPATPGATTTETIVEESDHFSFEESALSSVTGGSGRGLAVPTDMGETCGSIKQSRSETALSSRPSQQQLNALGPKSNMEKQLVLLGRQDEADGVDLAASEQHRRTIQLQEETGARAPSPLTAFLTSAARLTISTPVVSLEEEEARVRQRAAELSIILPRIRVANAPRTETRLRRRQLQLANRAIHLRSEEFRDLNHRTQLIIF